MGDDISGLVISVIALILTGIGMLAGTASYLLKYHEESKANLTARINEIQKSFEDDINGLRKETYRQIDEMRNRTSSSFQKLEDDLRSAIEHNRNHAASTQDNFSSKIDAIRKELEEKTLHTYQTLNKATAELRREVDIKTSDIRKALDRLKYYLLKKRN